MNKVLFQDFCSCTAENHHCKSHQEEYVGWRLGNQPCDQKVAGSIPRANTMASIRSSSAAHTSALPLWWCWRDGQRENVGGLKKYISPANLLLCFSAA
ncbi:hypothetical protein SRHO_G00154130 [Serrasalmus rhombeus]